jgi:hypothetical protein
MFRTKLFIFAAMLSACTSVHYESPRLARERSGDQTIAVLPFEMVFAGTAPAALGADEIEAIEVAESLAFQSSLYDRLLDRSSVHRRRPIQVHIQAVETTNRRLSAAGIGIRESWHLPAAELSEILSVDAVVRTRVRKTRYLSDLASYGTEVGLHLLHGATEGRSDWLIPPGLTRTHDIDANSTLLSTADGELLWKVGLTLGTDWRRPANDVVAGVCRKLAKKFPYRG